MPIRPDRQELLDLVETFILASSYTPAATARLRELGHDIRNLGDRSALLKKPVPCFSCGSFPAQQGDHLCSGCRETAEETGRTSDAFMEEKP